MSSNFFELDFWSHWMEGAAREAPTRKILTDFLGKDAEKPIVNSAAFSKSRPTDLWQHTYLTQHVSEGPFTFKPEHRAIDLSPTREWLDLFKLFEDGKSSPVPHSSQLPDFRDVFPESEKVHLGHRINSSFSADKILIAACGHCHRSESVRSFKVSQLESLSTEMKAEIIRRVALNVGIHLSEKIPNTCQRLLSGGLHRAAPQPSPGCLLRNRH